MGRKQRKKEQRSRTATSGRPLSDDAYLPFRNVKVEKLPEKSRRKESGGLVIGGFDKNADFGDILDAWMGGRDPDKVTRAEGRRVDEDKRPFADIFAEWERRGKGEAERKIPEEKIRKSAPYRQTRDFGEILSQYEGKAAKGEEGKEKKERKGGSAGKSVFKASGKSFGEVLDRFEGKRREEEKRGKETGEGKAEAGEAERRAGGVPAHREDGKERKKEPVAWSFAQIYRKWNEKSDEERAIEEAEENRGESARQEPTIMELRNMQPQVTLDLHGCKAEEAAGKARAFLEDSVNHKLMKVCVIPGKGLHSEGEPVLKNVVLSEIRLSGLVREAYSPKACYGGSGAIWIILKERKAESLT